jgi:hypothetical protein
MTVEFRTDIRDGRIKLPDEVKQQFDRTKSVKVTISDDVETAQRDIIAELLQKPLIIEGFKPMTRDEIYDRP